MRLRVSNAAVGGKLRTTGDRDEQVKVGAPDAGETAQGAMHWSSRILASWTGLGQSSKQPDLSIRTGPVLGFRSIMISGDPGTEIP